MQVCQLHIFTSNRYSQTLTLLVVLLFTQSVPANQQNDIFSRVFGNATTIKTHEITVPVYIYGKQYGEVRIITGNSIIDVEIYSTDILKLLKELLIDEQFDTIKSAFFKNTLFGKDLIPFGINIFYDTKKLQLNLEIPMELRKTETISFIKQGGNTKNVIHPSDFSAYFNLYSEHNYDWTTNKSLINSSFDYVSNYKSWVFETESTYSNRPKISHEYGDFTITKDFTEHDLRLIFLDQSNLYSGFQASASFAGLSLSRSFSMRPNMDNRITAQKNFLLEQPSTVEIRINNNRYRTIRLSPGRYHLSDLPISVGINDITLIIIEDSGRTRSIEFPFFSHSTLLKAKQHEFSYSLGYPSSGYENKYNTDHLFLSMYHKYGYSDTLTYGLNLQTLNNNILLGGEFHEAGPAGNFSVLQAISKSSDNTTGSAYSLTHWYQNAINNSYSTPSYETNLSYFTDSFSSPDSTSNNLHLKSDLSSGISQQINNSTSLVLRARHQTSHIKNGNNKDINIYMNHHISSKASWNLSLNWNRSSRVADNYSINISYNYAFSNKRDRLQLNFDSSNLRKEINWNHSPESNHNEFAIETNLVDSISDKKIGAMATYSGNRFNSSIELIHNTNKTTDVKNQISKINFSSALTYTGGHYGISRPVTDSFAIIAPHNNLEGRSIVVDRHNNDYTAISDSIGPAVIPDLIAYRYRTISIDIENLPIGYSIGNRIHKLIMGYKSGTLVPIGSDANIILKGRITNNGNPVALTVGRLSLINQSSYKPVTFFTNRKGIFQAVGLKPGHYNLQLLGYDDAYQLITIKPDVQGVYNIGTIRLVN